MKKKIALEVKLQSELNLAGIVGAGNLSECRRVEIPIWIAKVRMVKGVKELGPELDVIIFLEPEVLEDTQGPVLVAGTLDDISSGVPVRVRRRFGKDGLVKPILNGWIVYIGIPTHIWTLAYRAGSNIGNIARDLHIHR